MSAASLDRLIELQGFEIQLTRRATTSAEEDDVAVLQAIQSGWTPRSGIDEVDQTETVYTIRHSDLVDLEYPYPPAKGDKILDEGQDRVRNIDAARPLYFRGEVFGWRLEVRG